MSFVILLQKTSSDSRSVTKNLTDIYTLTGTLKNSTSIINPIIVVECDVSILSECNYMYIASFNRYYFINDIVSLSTGLAEIHAHVDVLTSFADEIRANRGIVARQENIWNLYVNDGAFKVYQNSSVLTRPFPSGFNTMEFILAVAGSP